VFVRRKGGYWSRSRTEEAIKRAPDEKALAETVPKEVLRGFLEQDFTKGRGKDDRDLLKGHFRKMPTEAIREALGQPEPKVRPKDPTVKDLKREGII